MSSPADEQSIRERGFALMGPGIVHEMNNFLSPILGFSELALRLSPVGEESKQWLTRIHSGAERGQTLVASLRHFIGHSGQPEEIDLAKLVRLTAKLLKPTASLAGARFELTLTPSPLRAHPGKIHFVVLAFFVHALDAFQSFADEVETSGVEEFPLAVACEGEDSNAPVTLKVTLPAAREPDWSLGDLLGLPVERTHDGHLVTLRVPRDLAPTPSDPDAPEA